jgi:hypothetical protein
MDYDKSIKMVGRWDYSKYTEPTVYGRETTYKEGAEFLDGHGKIEDWGCGIGGFRKFIKNNEYIGIDGSVGPFTDKVVDLEEYTSNVPCIFMRAVLEHNFNWRQILKNAMLSFTDRMVLVTYTPWKDKETLEYVDCAGIPIIDFNKKELTDFFGDVAWTEKQTESNTEVPETIFFLSK